MRAGRRGRREQKRGQRIAGRVALVTTIVRGRSVGRRRLTRLDDGRRTSATSSNKADGGGGAQVGKTTLSGRGRGDRRPIDACVQQSAFVNNARSAAGADGRPRSRDNMAERLIAPSRCFGRRAGTLSANRSRRIIRASHPRQRSKSWRPTPPPPPPASHASIRGPAGRGAPGDAGDAAPVAAASRSPLLF